MSEPPSTDDIILDRAIQGTDATRCVDWAIGMLMAGYDADYLCRLAGQLPPFDLDSVAGLRDRALAELGFHDLTNDTQICHTVANALRQHRSDELRTQKTLESAKWLYVTRNIRDLQPLYLLSHALEDLKQSDHQWYVDGMNQSNATQLSNQIVDRYLALHRLKPCHPKISNPACHPAE